MSYYILYRLCFLLKLKYTISPSSSTNIHEIYSDCSRTIQIPLENSYLVNLSWMPSGYQKASLQHILILFNQNILIDIENFEHIKLGWLNQSSDAISLSIQHPNWLIAHNLSSFFFPVKCSIKLIHFGRMIVYK